MSCCEKCLRYIESFAAASMRLHLAAWDNGGDGVLREVDVSLCEDLRSVMVYAMHKNGADICACFELPAPTTEQEFDWRYWRSVFDPAADEAGGDDEVCCCCGRTGAASLHGRMPK